MKPLVYHKSTQNYIKSSIIELANQCGISLSDIQGTVAELKIEVNDCKIQELVEYSDSISGFVYTYKYKGA